jgi:predicted phage terminase large subunit-like protein
MSLVELPEIKPGDKTWHKFRDKARTDLWWLNEMLGHDKIPMVPRTHLSMIMFADRKTGIPEVDACRVQRILVPREYGKSKMITLTRTLRNILRNPNHTAGIANESTDMAKGFLGEIKQVFEENELLQLLFPEIIPSEGERHDMRWAAEKIDVKRNIVRKEPTVLAAGIDKTVTGVHMAEWILDDIMSNEAAENARAGSFTEIEKIKRWMNRLEPLCDGPGTPITLIGTPWWEGDCYDHAVDLWGGGEEPREYEWALKLPDGSIQYHILTVQGELSTFKLPLIVDGKITFPEKWPERRWLHIQRNDPELFAANFMLDPASEVIRDFKDAWLRYYDWTVPDRQLKYRDRGGEIVYAEAHEFACTISVDPAISESVKADYSGIIVSGTLNGIEHIIFEAIAERLGVLDLIKKIEDLSRKYKPRRIYIETVQYQKALAQLLQHKHLPIVEAKPGTKVTKEMRIRGLEPFFRLGHVYIHATHTDFIREYQRFPRSRHDDLLDAMAYLTNDWSRIIGRESKAEEKRRKYEDQQIQKLRDWGRGARHKPDDQPFDREMATDRWTK